MVTVECHTCGDEFDRKPSKVERSDRQFCSRECYYKAGRPDIEGENNPANPAVEMVTLTCEQCGDGFEVYPYREDSARFCSRECHDDSMRGVTGEDAASWQGAQETYECQNCGEGFLEYPYRNDREYCSVECYREASSSIFSGDGNPAWRGGYDPYYGPNWDEQRKKAIDRDGRRCQDCGKHADDMDTAPDVHHKKRLGWFKEEYDAPEWWEKANRLENLVTLCAACHMAKEWKDGGGLS